MELRHEQNKRDPLKKIRNIYHWLLILFFFKWLTETTLNFIESLCLHIYQVTYRYQLDSFKGSTRNLPIFQKRFQKSLLPLPSDFLLLRHETSVVNLKAHFLHNKKNNSTLNCTHKNFLTELHLLATSWNGSESEKRKEQVD